MHAEPPADHAALMQLVRTDLREQPAQASRLATEWFDQHPGQWAEAIVAAELGSHQPHFEAYRLLDAARRAELVGRVVERCRREGRRGLRAGAFMLGRLVSSVHPVAFWNALAAAQVAFALDEWVRYLEYLAVLDEVGARRLRLARQRIEMQGLGPLRLRPAEALVFTPLKLSERSLERVEAALDEHAEPETRALLALLRKPYGALYDYALPWSLAQLEQLCRDAGLPLPPAEAR